MFIFYRPLMPLFFGLSVNREGYSHRTPESLLDTGTRERGIRMSGRTDDAKGRTKEAIGALTDDDELRREGKADQMAGTAKKKLDDAKEWVEDKIDVAKDVADRRRHDT